MIQVVWEFVVRPEAVARFEEAYGSEGLWCRLFRRYSGYRGTALLRDEVNLRRYLTVDSWDTAEQRSEMLSDARDEYAELDLLLGELTETERELGLFTTIG
jgi:hypothetical protein